MAECTNGAGDPAQGTLLHAGLPSLAGGLSYHGEDDLIDQVTVHSATHTTGTAPSLRRIPAAGNAGGGNPGSVADMKE